MKPQRRIATSPWLPLLAGVLLAGCLEVEQHPPWQDGYYDGKRDALHHQARFHGNRMAWNAALTDRTLLQDEYRRTGRPGDARVQPRPQRTPPPSTAPRPPAQEP